jgi:hypothetical protein
MRFGARASLASGGIAWRAVRTGTPVYTRRGMGGRIKRDELDRIAATYALDASAVDAMLDAAAARPGADEQREFFARGARYGGILSLAASIVFFVAANWNRIAVFGRFALLEILLLAIVGLALMKPPPRFVGRAALFLAFVVTGALLALFGQTYQTGADVYELFLTWSLLGLPFVLLARWGVASAAWVLVFNTALMLFCGWQPPGGLLWALFDSHWLAGYVILVSGALDLALWIAFETLAWPAVPEWVRRLIVTCGMAFVTWAGITGVERADEFAFTERVQPPSAAWAYLAMIVVAVVTLRRRRDVYPLALAMAGFILVSLCWIPKGIGGGDTAMVFVMAVWLIGSSGIGGRVLLTLTRRWRAVSA